MTRIARACAGGDLAPFTETPTAEVGGWIYVSGDYRIERKVAGFGIEICRAEWRGQLLMEAVGHVAFDTAMDACQRHAAGWQ